MNRLYTSHIDLKSIHFTYRSIVYTPGEYTSLLDIVKLVLFVLLLNMKYSPKNNY